MHTGARLLLHALDMQSIVGSSAVVCRSLSKVHSVPLDKRLLAESSVASKARALPTPWCGALWPSEGLSSEAV